MMGSLLCCVSPVLRMQKDKLFSFWFAFILIAALACAMRAYDIESRPLHSDEGVNWHFLQEMSRTGVYPYSHENYHGPAYFWLSFSLTRIFGESVLGMRLASILSGLLLLPVLIVVRPLAGSRFVLLAALLLAVSPSMVFHSRYGIHEMLFILSSALFALNLYRLLQAEDLRCIYFLACALALLIATKETFVITLAAVGLPALLLAAGSYRRFMQFIRAEAIHFPQALLLLSSIVILFYSSGLRSFKGVRELFFSIPQWIGRGTTSDPGHFKPRMYYLKNLIWETEPYLPLLFTAACLILLFVLFLSPRTVRQSLHEQRNKFGFFLFSWAVLIGLVYSFIPYKTPWLVINITFPALLFCAWLLNSIWDWQGTFAAAAALVFTVIVLYAVKSTVTLNYSGSALPAPLAKHLHCVPYGSPNPFSYVYTSPGMLEVVQRIKEYWQTHPQAKVLVGTKGYWPLPYYLREKSLQAGYFVPENIEQYTGEYEIILVDHFRPWKNTDWPATYYRLSDVTEAFFYQRPQH